MVRLKKSVFQLSEVVWSSTSPDGEDTERELVSFLALPASACQTLWWNRSVRQHLLNAKRSALRGCENLKKFGIVSDIFLMRGVVMTTGV